MSLKDELLGKEHDDIKYLKREDIGMVISQGLSETYRVKPHNPVEFFAKWLLNHSQTKKRALAGQVQEAQIAQLKEKNEEDLKAQQSLQNQKDQQEQSKATKRQQFLESLSKSTDLTDNLEELSSFIEDFTSATGTYIGHLTNPLKEIQDDDDETAHIDSENPKVIHFQYTSKSHDFMKDTILKPDQGITHDVFKLEDDVDDDAGSQGGKDDQAKDQKKGDPNDLLNTFKHVFVKEVVREQKIFYQKVPRLGSYMAVPLVYNSCMNEKSLDLAIADYQEVQLKLDEQQKEKDAYEQEQEELKAQKEKDADGNELPQNDDEPAKEWPKIETKPFETEEERYVVCLDSMGQDRAISDDQRRLVLETVQQYIKIWEDKEVDNLSKDRNLLIAQLKADTSFKADQDPIILEELEKQVEDFISSKEDIQDEEEKQGLAQQQRLMLTATLFKEKDEIKNSLLSLVQFNVIKFRKILQSTFYLLGYSRDEVCEERSNKMFWKKAKALLNDQFIEQMIQYQTLGENTKEGIKSYQTLNFVEKNIEGIAQEDVEAYHQGLARLYKWLLVAIQARKSDITRRIALNKRNREDRELKIQQSKERQEKREQDLVEAEEKFKEEHKDEIEAVAQWEEKQNAVKDEYGEEDNEDDDKQPEEKPELPVFNKEEFLEKWDSEFPEIEIPDEEKDLKNNDWALSQEQIDEIINQYNSNRGEQA